MNYISFLLSNLIHWENNLKHLISRGDFRKFSVKSAFSLSELLVALTIIGVIAALVITNIVSAIDEKKNMVALRKIQNSLTQVTQLVIVDNMSPLYWNLSEYDYNSAQKAYSYYRPYFKVLRECSNQEGCWKYPTKYLSGRVYLTHTEPYQYMFTLTDGMNVLINVFSKEIIEEEFGVRVDAPSVVFIVDVNGDRRPNQVGSDIFAFVLDEDRILPAGADSTYNCNTAGFGLACTARVMSDNWKISYY